MTDRCSHTHRMTLFNFDLVIKWHSMNDEIVLTAITIIHISQRSNLIDFMSERVFRAIVDDIKKQQDEDRRK
jgi:hypothetical protein